ncbi:MAG: pantoate--beta-alanine ligase [Alphaproteobacteria bacterium]|nr:pantoate--beta-alanine ligase [Alphaproteobacteria bacterium]
MTDALPIARTVRELRTHVARWRNQNLTVGFAPTMGALHDGHLELVRALQRRCDRTIASIFVNPKQFAAHEDLDRYPRNEAGDAALLAGVGCDLIYAPTREVMYPDGHSTSVSVAGISEPLEGEARPHFFGGVATVVTKLLLQCLPDVAAFGEKDYQQLLVIKRMVRDLDMPVEILAVPTLREADGLAMSSRNAYLSKEERIIASRLNLILREAVEQLESGANIMTTLVKIERQIFKSGFRQIDYVAIRGDEDFLPIASPIVRRPARLLVAVWAGETRLIDNVAVGIMRP